MDEGVSSELDEVVHGLRVIGGADAEAGDNDVVIGEKVEALAAIAGVVDDKGEGELLAPLQEPKQADGWHDGLGWSESGLSDPVFGENAAGAPKTAVKDQLAEFGEVEGREGESGVAGGVAGSVRFPGEFEDAKGVEEGGTEVVVPVDGARRGINGPGKGERRPAARLVTALVTE